MARPVRDDVVLMALRDSDNFSDASGKYSEFMSMCSGTVKDTQDKIRLSESEFGLPHIGIADSLLKNYKSLSGIKATEYVLEMEGEQPIQISREALRMLKSLCIEQVSRSGDYSGIVTAYFFQLVKVIRGSKSVIDDSTLTPVGVAIFKAFNKVIADTVDVKYEVQIGKVLDMV